MPKENKQKTLYIFIDESGNFDFTPTGTKYFVLTAVSTIAPLKSRDELLRKVHELKYAEWGMSQLEDYYLQPDYYFHASEDKQEIRDWVYAAIKKLDDIEIDTISAQKNKTNPSLYTRFELIPNSKEFLPVKTVRSEELFYDKMSRMLLQYIFRRHEHTGDIEKIIVVLGSLFTKAKRGYVFKSLGQYLKQNFKKTFHIYFRSSASDINCQIADYCAWAVYVKAEKGERRPWEEVKGKVKSHFDVFARGNTEYYEYRN
ncbi:MAG: DUF3800 domain-containing protein [Candidatus Vogelbacteria bacterium]|nr:DUF3800 domain-containing protein [Candidatus Vogelbacteria bacterium]